MTKSIGVKIEYILIVAYIALESISSFFIKNRAIFSNLTLILSLIVCWGIARAKGITIDQVKDNRKNRTILLLVLNVFGTYIFYHSHYWSEYTTDFVKMRTYVVCAILLVILPVLSYFVKPFNEWIGNRLTDFQNILIKVRQISKKDILLTLLQYSIGSLIAWIFGHLAAAALHWKLPEWDYNIMVFWCCFTASNVIVTCWKFRKCLKKKFELFFMCIALLAGMFFCTFTPAECGISWDDEIHWANVESMADYFNGTTFRASSLFTKTYQRTAVSHFGYKDTERISRAELVNTSYEKKEIGKKYEENFAISYVGYIPHVIGVLLGRGLSLSYTATFRLGRYFGMFFYIAIVVAAMKKLRTGKLLLGFIALLPTAFYMAGSYSYDPWIISLSMYGYASFFHILQNKDEKVQSKDLAIMIVSLVLAFMVKAVYFPALFPLLFLPKNRFPSNKQHRWYLFFVFAAAIFLAMTIVLPMLVGTMDMSGDSRGGDGVDSGGQISFILSNPYQFVKIMGNFLFNTFMYPGNQFHWQQNYSYMSLVYKPPFYVITQFLFYIVAMYDQDGEMRATKWTRITGIFGIFCAIFLTALAMYISYTPVGYDTVNGCQFRYLLPFVFPVAYFLGFNFKIETKYDNLLYMLPIFILVATFVFWTGGNLYAGWSQFLFKVV